jgi:MerR family transcriptional regulator, light-induced transcriptional regulator
LSHAAATLARALDKLDEPAAQATFDRLLADFTVETVLRNVVMPYSHELGIRWQPLAILACAPEELHDLALLVFRIVLNRKGWRVGYLGVSTPLDDVMTTAAELHPDLVVLAASVPERFTAHTNALSRLARIAPLALAGAGATKHIADAVSARLLGDDPVTEAQRM